jgi:HPt (histidine-containing phosphotransfer) domain-containing protein
MGEKPVLTIDRELADLVPAFLQRKRADLEAMIACAHSGDFDAIVRTAHRLAGEGGSYGFQKITDDARTIERAARASQADLAAALARELLDYLDSVQIVYIAEE